MWEVPPRKIAVAPLGLRVILGLHTQGLRPGLRASASFGGAHDESKRPRGIFQTPSYMGVATGIVVAGKAVVEGLDLPEGSMVTILTTEPEGEVYLSSEEEEALLESMAEADRGETISAEELFARLDQIAKL